MELLLDGCQQRLCSFLGVAVLPLLRKIQNLVGALVCTAGAAPFGDETRNALGVEDGLGGIEGLAAGAEAAGHVGDWPIVHAMAAQHFIFDLNNVVGIEELAVLKRFVLNGLWPWMERACCTKHCFLVFWRGRHLSTHLCHINYIQILPSVNLRSETIPLKIGKYLHIIPSNK